MRTPELCKAMQKAVEDYFGMKGRSVTIAITNGDNVAVFFSGAHLECLGLVPFVEAGIMESIFKQQGAPN